ncbi:MAG TPA: hypothetical protein DCQ26_03470 [Marinilabiliales bacterium]|jgi:hypothetical protein|nr:MAG: hypothetical protein A2W95_12575 [Bacteroidetes bacterium GWA2_40_14]OFX58958.1 MAG: hypothetical protein A2W84_11595 [Bacteroidetes bacterium GWC2_40_13]OFX71328.1 MAG: hypothetical protein A2W96_14280 [Bacteroidetes bacterium GWD2_40_43]OFX91477.1 MAG: hypothetical protein A2W97_04575 [Bacteroidetes bacterium GWE2_40_63]OFY19546.1 MAG: hypothetical protein A2W88_02455 [Bacteroidetes bacterium GWF2_40_13]OFZ32189.1 MAG: hypothetical protein A2437_19425 [Bacteroidetes bacterium RIFOXYC
MKTLVNFIFIIALALNSFGQAKKPTIMVVPSDRLCISKGFSQTFDNQGTQETLPDYKKALQNDGDLRLVISKMSGMMADRGFPLKDLEQELKNLAQEAAESNMMTSSSSGSAISESPIDILKRTAKADIIMDLDFEIKRQGPNKYIVFTLNGLDAYTSKNVASASGAGQPSSAATPEILLEEAVLSYMDEFNGRLMTHFQDMFTNGREVKVMIKTFANAGISLEDDYDISGNTDMLSMHIEDWMANNTQGGRFNLSDGTANFMRFEQVRIATEIERNGKMRAQDTRMFVNELSKYLRTNCQIESKVYLRGLGEAWLIVGEK